MTFDQLEPSANAPWTSTMVGLAAGDCAPRLPARPASTAKRILVVRVILCAPKSFEIGEELGHERLRLLPSGEVATLGERVVMNQLGIRFLGPVLRRLIELVRK